MTKSYLKADSVMTSFQWC